MASLPQRHFQTSATRWKRLFQVSGKGTGDVTSLQKDSSAPQCGRVKKLPDWDDDDDDDDGMCS